MTDFEFLQKIVQNKTAGNWHVGWIDENLDRSEIESEDGVIICENTNRRDETFICTVANLAPLIMEVLTAAEKAEHCYLSPEDTIALSWRVKKLKTALREIMKCKSSGKPEKN